MFSRGSLLVTLPIVVLTAASTCVGLLLAPTASALPLGRSWAPTLTWDYPGIAGYSQIRIESDSLGIPFLVMDACWPGDDCSPGSGHGTWNVFTWEDTGWVHRLDSAHWGRLPETALSLTSRQFMTWMTGTYDRDGFVRMVMAEVGPGSIAPPDTAIKTTSQDNEYDAAVSARRRWVVRSHQNPPYDGSVPPQQKVATAYSDTPGVWRRLPDIGIDEDHCAIAPLGDTTALVVYAGESGLAYSVAEGSRWTSHGVIDPQPWRGTHPRLRFRPSGGLWLLWTDRFWVHVSHYRDRQWFRGDSLAGIHNESETYWAAWCDLTLDGAERPVLAWGDLGFGYTYRDVGMVSFPTESGWSPGEEIPGSENMFATPLVARDRNGDVWANWRMRDFTTNRWTHTYVHATCSLPVVRGTGTQRTVSWSLSELAPESWWAVLRTRNGAASEEVARVQAGEAVEMSWTDKSPPAGVLSYKIRRESVDSRYRWESQQAIWPPTARRPLALVRATSAILAGDLELVGADPGPVEVRVYDIQGRLVVLHRAVASGTGRDSIPVDLQGDGRNLGAGVYFATARDASGREALPLKVVILK